MQQTLGRNTSLVSMSAQTELKPNPLRVHAYGDNYSSPGIDLRQKQLMSSAFLVRAFAFVLAVRSFLSPGK